MQVTPKILTILLNNESRLLNDIGLFSETKMLSILSVLLSLMITTDAYTFVYQPMPLYPMYQGGECKIDVNQMFNVILGA